MDSESNGRQPIFSRIHPAWLFFGAPALVLAGLVVLLAGRTPPPALIVHCAASQRIPMEKIADDYERDGRGRIELRFGGSQSLLTNIELTGRGDVFLPADDSYVEMARAKGLTVDVFPLARMNAVLVVAAGNPKKIASWSDLFRRDVSVAQAEPDVAAIGRLTRERLRKTNQWTALDAKTTVKKATVTDVANSVALTSVDCGIVWDVVALADPTKLTPVELPELAGVQANVSLATLSHSRDSAEAAHFARYVVEDERARRHFEQSHFQLHAPKAR